MNECRTKIPKTYQCLAVYKGLGYVSIENEKNADAITITSIHKI